MEDHSDEEAASSGDSAVHSPCRKPRRWLTRKDNGKRKVSDSGTDRNELDQRELPLMGHSQRLGSVGLIQGSGSRSNGVFKNTVVIILRFRVWV